MEMIKESQESFQLENNKPFNNPRQLILTTKLDYEFVQSKFKPLNG
jgi:hypothetical protein